MRKRKEKKKEKKKRKKRKKEKKEIKTRSNSANSERRRSPNGSRPSALTHSINLEDGDVEASKEGEGVLGDRGSSRDKEDTTIQTKTLLDSLEHQFIGDTIEHGGRRLGAASLLGELLSHPVLLSLKKENNKNNNKSKREK